MAKLENDVLLKTKLFGFDKAGAMDYIEKIQLENEGLKRQVQDLSAKQNVLLKENSMLRQKIEMMGGNADTSGRSYSSIPSPELMGDGEVYTGKVTFEDLSEPPAPQPQKKVITKKNVVKKGGKTYITSKK